MSVICFEFIIEIIIIKILAKLQIIIHFYATKKGKKAKKLSFPFFFIHFVKWSLELSVDLLHSVYNLYTIIVTINPAAHQVKCLVKVALIDDDALNAFA